MTIFEWAKTLSPERAGKILSTYAIVMAVVQIILQTAASVADGGLANGLPAVVWGLIWWNAKKQNFKIIFQISVGWIIIQLIAVSLLFTEPSNSGIFQYNHILLMTGTLLVIALWSFPLLLGHALKGFVLNEAKKSNISNENSLSGPWVTTKITKNLSMKNDTRKSNSADKNYEDGISKNDTVGNDEQNIDDVFLKMEPDQIEQKVDSIKKRIEEASHPQKISQPSELNDDNLRKQASIKALAEKYSKGRLAIQYRKDAKIGWEELKDFPLKFKLQYLDRLSKDPKSDVKKLLEEIKESYEKFLSPFGDQNIDGHYIILLKQNEAAAEEFKKVIKLLGDTVDPSELAETLQNRFGVIGKRILEYRDEIQSALENGELPDRHFQHICSNDFDKFVKQKKIATKKPQDQWNAFMINLYEKCGWEPPQIKRQ